MPNTLTPLRLETSTRVLDNGLRVVAHADHTTPLVAVHLMLHAGSRHERAGRTGLAHLLEHLLFEGTENCPKGQFDRLLEEVGGTNNGSTWLDRTNYYETVPSHALELALWLERERMAHFLPLFDQAMLDLQRGVVINERRQVYENRPYGLADERLMQLLFPEGHPYSWPTIGYVPDLRDTTLEDAREFYTRYYDPANAVLVLAGDVDEQRAFELAERYLGDLPSAGPPSPDAVVPVAAAQIARDVLEDEVTFERFYRAHAVPPFGTRDWVALDLLTYVLSDGETSRLQRELVRERQIAQDADAYLYPTEVQGILGFTATARSGHTAEQLEQAVDEVVRRVADDGVGERELAGAMRRARRDHLSALATVENRADELAYATTLFGEPEALNRVLDLYGRITPDEVRDAARQFTGGGARLAVLPEAEVAA